MLDTAVKKWVSKILIFTFACLCLGPVELAAKKGREGAQVIIEKLDGQSISSELLKVEGDQLILALPPEMGNKVSIHEIKVIKVRKKGKFWQGAVLVVAVSMIAGAIKGLRAENAGSGFLWGAFIGGIYGSPLALIGGSIAASEGKSYKTYKLAGADPATIRNILAALDKRARF